MGRLASGGAAYIKDEISRLWVKYMRHQHGAFILHLPQALRQGGNILHGSVSSYLYSFRYESRLFNSAALISQASHQPIPVCLYCICPHRQHRRLIVKAADFLRCLVAKQTYPMLNQPARVHFLQRQILSCLPCSLRERSCLRLPRSPSENRIDKTGTAFQSGAVSTGQIN